MSRCSRSSAPPCSATRMRSASPHLAAFLMLLSLQASGVLLERKARLFACACVRRIWHLLPDERLGQAVAVSERHADGRVTDRDLGAAVGAAHREGGERADARHAAYDAACYHPGAGWLNTFGVMWYASAAAGFVARYVPPLDILFSGDAR